MDPFHLCPWLLAAQIEVAVWRWPDGSAWQGEGGLGRCTLGLTQMRWETDQVTVQRVVADGDSDHKDLGQEDEESERHLPGPGCASVITTAASTACIRSFIHSFSLQSLSTRRSQALRVTVYNVLIKPSHVVTLQGSARHWESSGGTKTPIPIVPRFNL